MAKPSYYEQLRDARWQEKRLRIMERDEFTCQKCGKGRNDGITLNVDHAYYEKGKSPWEYPDESLTTLCEDCHKRIGKLRTLLLSVLSVHSIEQIIGYAEAIRFQDGGIVRFNISSADYARGISDCLCCSFHDLYDLDIDDDGCVEIDVGHFNRNIQDKWDLLSAVLQLNNDDLLRVRGYAKARCGWGTWKGMNEHLRRGFNDAVDCHEDDSKALPGLISFCGM